MADPFSDVVFNPNPQNMGNNRYLPSSFNHQTNHSENSKLPKIEKQSAKVKLFAKHLIKSSTKLPNLKIDATNLETQAKGKQTIMSNTNILVDKSKNRQKSQGDDFMTEIQKKLKVVLEGQHNQDFAEPSDSDQDFQKKIMKNKQIIKKQKLRREIQNQSMHENMNNFLHNNSNNPISFSDKKVQSISPNKQILNNNKIKIKADSIYERRIRDYRQQSLGNKILLKKKQILKQHAIKKNAEQAEQLPLNNFRTAKNKSSHRKIINKKVSNKMVQSMTKDQDMFDSIHNILLNPIRKSQNDIVREKPKKTMQTLQEQLKQIQQKLNHQRKQDLQMLSRIKFIPKKQGNTSQPQPSEQETITNMNKDDHTLSWRKIVVSHANLESKKSNFDEQIQRVNKYFEKSQRSIEKYIENQKRLVNMVMLKKKNQQGVSKVNI